MSLSSKVIGCAFEVHRTLGCGFLEAIYEKALATELSMSGLRYANQPALTVHYKGRVVGEYRADFIVEACLLLELKAKKALTRVDQAQMLNYLRASRAQVGLLLNFGTKSLEIKRMVNGIDERGLI
jgi:GxxExxY protein